jgi:hypothetical protein
MKKSNLVLVFSFFLSLFLSCNEESNLDELKTQNSIQKDVYVENGILVFENETAFDSINKVVNQFTDDQFETWQKGLGFVSAEKYLEPVFQEYDNLQSEQELDDFIAKYKGKLLIEKDEDGNYSVDYPYCSMLWLRIMNKNGVFKIGDILHSYERNYIAVLDGDLNKLKIAKKNPEKFAVMQGENNVYVEQYSNLKSDPYYNNFVRKETYHEWTLENDDEDERLIVRLECISRWDASDNRLKALPYIWVKAEKDRTFGGWSRRRSLFEIASFAAEIDYPGGQWGNNNYFDVRHNIFSLENYKTSNKRCYGTFVFDEYKRVDVAPSDFYVIPECLNIDVRFWIAGSEVGSQECWLWGRVPFYPAPDYPTYQDGYPQWHVNN